jgi:hypothetical protein
VYTSAFPRCLTRKGYIDLASPSFELPVLILVTEDTVAIELFEGVCSSGFAFSLVLVRGRCDLGSRAGAAFVTVVTAPIPFTEDFTTGSSLVLSSTRSSIGIGYRISPARI